MCANVVYSTLDPLRIVSMVFMCVVDHFTNETKPLPAQSNIKRVICNETYHALGLSCMLQVSDTKVHSVGSGRGH